ncbi:DNA primase [Lysinibacillus sp. BF-4]|uniref:DNA primase n=1 Tax=Lysinibacillus sp. BF-4 TaxID=1473546 RepID=UPI0005060D27|nr:DNA primase [Lysinibacillus sp. BF-4]KFL42796.1 DNA primase [Lysinibacillus sp. BF-4]
MKVSGVAKIPEHIIEDVRSQSDIVDVISEYMQLTKRGRNWFGLCPFHGEQTPSFSVSTDKQIYRCFGCGAGGNALTFVMDIEGITFPEAVIKLGERAGIAIDSTELHVTPTKQVSAEETRMLEAHEFAASFFHHLLLNTEDGEAALAYLQGRGFSEEMIKEYQIGYALPNWEALSILLERQGFELDEMAASGLIIAREDGSYFDRFRERIMFPLRNDLGKVVGFSGRVLPTSEEEAKYLNSPDSPIFHKSEVLYNLDRARPSIRKERRVILMEGFMDVLAAAKAGVTNAVATMGTSLTDQHCHKLKRLAEQITICYDGDQAGLEATKRAATLLQQKQMQIEVAILPDGLDPDDYIEKYGAEQFIEQIVNSPHAYLAFIKYFARKGKNFAYENDILQYTHEVLVELAKRSSPMERDLYIRQLAQETNISEEAIYADYHRLERTAVQAPTVETPPVIAPLDRKMTTGVDVAERIILAHMLLDASVVYEVRTGENTNAPFLRDAYNAVFVHLLAFYEKNEPNYQRFLTQLEEAELRKIVVEAATFETNEDRRQEEVADSLAFLRKERIKWQLEELKQASQEAEKTQDYAKTIELAKQYVALQKQLRLM